MRKEKKLIIKMKIPYIAIDMLLKNKEEEFKPSIIDITENRAPLKNYIHENLVFEKGMAGLPKTTKRDNKKENDEKKLVITSRNLFIFHFQMIIDYFSSGSKFKRFYRFKDKAKLPIEEQTKNSKNMDTSNSSQIDELLLKNMNDEEKNFFEEADNIYENDSKNKKNIEDSQHCIETESGNKKGQIIKGKLEMKVRQEQKTTIHLQKENTNKNEKELEFEKYFVPVETDNDNANYEKEKIIEEKFLKIFSSKGDKEIDIMEISLESFLLTLNKFSNNHCFEGKYYIKKIDDKYFISFSEWLYRKEYFTLSEILFCLIEMHIILSWHNKIMPDIKKISGISSYNDLTIEIFDNYFTPNQINSIAENDIISKKNIAKQVKKVRDDLSNIKQEIIIKNTINEVNQDFETDNIYYKGIITRIYSELSNIKSENKIKTLLLDILPLDIYSLINGRRFVYWYLREYIINYLNLFFNYMTSQITNYSKIIGTVSKRIQSYFSIILNYHIRWAFEELRFKYCLNVDFFEHGSNGLGLCIEGSDIDLYLYSDYGEYEDSSFAKILKEIFGRYAIVSEKIIINPQKYNLITVYFCFQENTFENPYNYIDNYDSNSPGHLNEIGLPVTESVKVDITFTNNKKKYVKKKEIHEKIKEKLKQNPEIKDCLFVLKRIMIKNKLNKHYDGGIFPHALLTLLVYAEDRLLKYEEKIESGKLLSLFLIVYSKYDFLNYVVAEPGRKLITKEEYPIPKYIYLPNHKNILIKDAFDESNLIVTGFTKSSKNSSVNEQCEKIQNLFRLLLGVCKRNFSKYLTSNNLKENDFELILDLINAK